MPVHDGLILRRSIFVLLRFVCTSWKPRKSKGKSVYIPYYRLDWNQCLTSTTNVFPLIEPPTLKPSSEQWNILAPPAMVLLHCNQPYERDRGHFQFSMMLCMNQMPQLTLFIYAWRNVFYDSTINPLQTSKNTIPGGSIRGNTVYIAMSHDASTTVHVRYITTICICEHCPCFDLYVPVTIISLSLTRSSLHNQSPSPPIAFLSFLLVSLEICREVGDWPVGWTVQLRAEGDGRRFVSSRCGNVCRWQRRGVEARVSSPLLTRCSLQSYLSLVMFYVQRSSV